MRKQKTLKLKICGMREGENISDVARYAPDFMGFIFYKGSKRFVGEDFIIDASFPDSIKRVGVFVNESLSEILRLAQKHKLDFVQLHGEESTELCANLQNNRLSVIKVFSIGEGFDFRLVDPYKKVVDYFLFDAKGNEYGGNGIQFNWEQLKNYDQEVPFFLGGGLTSENLSGLDNLRDLNLYSLDVNSGVEESPGVKSLNKITELVSRMENLNIKE